ncbi:MAG: outer membrane beta-barrel family protein [Bacteroidota bacterium]
MHLYLLRTLLLSFGIGIAVSANAQQLVIKGAVIDTINHQPLDQAVISLLRSKDSVLVQFVRTNPKGQFQLKGVVPAKYIILISYPNYADYVDQIQVATDQVNDLGNIPLLTKVQLLEEVIVKQKIAAIRMRGDTTEYRADSFRVSANANVQELLRKMPGITVNGKGEITAQGQKVEKVLVDGEEFFSDDPAVVTQNLRADNIDKVQAFDKKSDQAVFTGIDDGQTTKTINLVLKEDKKNGYFGKLETGSDADRYRYGKAMVNSFKAKKKVAAYITTDNTRYEALNWDERRNYGDDLNTRTEFSDDGGMMIWSSDDDFSNGQGFPNSITGGLHFSNKWNKDKHNSINTYQFNDIRVTGNNTSTIQTLLPDGSFLVNNSDDYFDSRKSRNRLRSTYEWNIDSTSSLKVIATGSVINSNANNIFNGSSFDNVGNQINKTFRQTISNAQEQNLLTTIFWRKRFKKAGRTISLSSDINGTSRSGDGFLFAENTFFSSGTVQDIDQKKTNDELLFGISTKISFTEPLSKKTTLEFNYRFENNRNNAERNTLTGGSGGTGVYDQLVNQLSNHFVYNNLLNTGGLNLRFNHKKITILGGAAIGSADFTMKDLRNQNNRAVNFTNFLPSFNFNYQIKKQMRLGFRYNGSTQNPTLQQINPIIDNTDPLNITIGNPLLKQEFNNRFSLSFSDYKVLKSKSIYFSANYSFVNNAITNFNSIDKATGMRFNQAVNVQGNYVFNIWSSYSFELFPSFNLNLNFRPTVTRFVNFIDGKENVNDSRNLNFGIGSGFWGEKWINYWFDLSASKNYSTSSINPNNTTRYWSYNLSLNVEMKLPKKWYINFEGNADIYQRTPIFANRRNIIILNGSIKKSLDKNENWQIKFRLNDMFNQNLGINRNITSNFISETTQQTIRRFGMLSLTYNFNKNGKETRGF